MLQRVTPHSMEASCHPHNDAGSRSSTQNDSQKRKNAQGFPSAFIGPRGGQPARHEGEDCLSAASSAAPEGGASRRATEPDNSGGVSWFVLLAAEKNEHHPALHPGISWIPHLVRYDTARHHSPNRRKALAVVAASTSATVTPRISAMRWAMRGRYDGSLRLPR